MHVKLKACVPLNHMLDIHVLDPYIELDLDAGSGLFELFAQAASEYGAFSNLAADLKNNSLSNIIIVVNGHVEDSSKLHNIRLSDNDEILLMTTYSGGKNT